MESTDRIDVGMNLPELLHMRHFLLLQQLHLAPATRSSKHFQNGVNV
jgi:hypothetical protein